MDGSHTFQWYDFDKHHRLKPKNKPPWSTGKGLTVLGLALTNWMVKEGFSSHHATNIATHPSSECPMVEHKSSRDCCKTWQRHTGGIGLTENSVMDS